MGTGNICSMAHILILLNICVTNHVLVHMNIFFLVLMLKWIISPNLQESHQNRYISDSHGRPNILTCNSKEAIYNLILTCEAKT